MAVVVNCEEVVGGVERRLGVRLDELRDGGDRADEVHERLGIDMLDDEVERLVLAPAFLIRV
jgi:hypothetical protein